VPIDDSSYLTDAELVEIHDSVIGLIGGMSGLRDTAALASCVAQPKTAVFGQERFPTLFDKAAAYCYFIVRLHPFFDGNKRTGLVAAVTFLLDHDVRPIFDEDRMHEAIIDVATGKLGVEDLAELFRQSVGKT